MPIASPRTERLVALGLAGILIVIGEIPAQEQAPRAATAKDQADAVITNTIGMKLKLIPKGEFEMGASDSDTNADNDEKPRHRVTISAPFYLGLHEVTQSEYTQVMGKNPSGFSATGGGKRIVAGISTDRFPVEKVSWYDAIAFCNALSEREHLKPYYRVSGTLVEIPDPKAQGYRLPTEAEWEYTCRAGSTTVYSFGDDVGQLGNVAWFADNSGRKPHPVGERKPNAFGLFDMHGNVWEWCWDAYRFDSYKEAAPVDPQGPSGGNTRVARGGSWIFGPLFCRSSNRYAFPPNLTLYADLGFRVARHVSPN